MKSMPDRIQKYEQVQCIMFPCADVILYNDHAFYPSGDQGQETEEGCVLHVSENSRYER